MDTSSDFSKDGRAGTRRLFPLVLLLILVGLGFRTEMVQAAPPSFQLKYPRQVEAGQPIVVTISARDVADIAGYESLVLFDTGAAEFSGLEQRQNALKRLGRDVTPVAAVPVDYGAAIGFYTCPVADCVTRGGPERSSGARGLVELGTVTLLALEPGRLEIAFSEIRLVDSTGTPIQMASNHEKITVQVGSAPSYHPAPAAPWTLGSGELSTAGSPPIVPDLTGDGLITNADVAEVALEWTISRHTGGPCGTSFDPTRDINGDGCIDIADLQLLASLYSPPSVTSTDVARDAAPSINQESSDPATEPVTTASLTFVVNAVADNPDANVGDGVCASAWGYCTLRAAIQEANANPGPDTINFGLWGSGVATIKLTWRLPTLYDESGPTTIDGYTQQGALPNSDALVSNAVIKVQIEGQGETSFDGLVITSSGNVVRGLALYRLQRPFYIYGGGATNNVIVGNFIGTDASGAYGAPVLGSDVAHGFHIEQGASGNQIGSPLARDRNVISGNGRHGVGFWHEGTNNNVVVNNIIGLSPLGDRRLPNRKHGLDLNFGAAYNRFGGLNPGERNVISGNDDTGVEVSHTSRTSNNQVVGNYIGTDVTGSRGTEWSANLFTGVTIEDGATNNVFSHNVIGNNLKGGIRISFGAPSVGNQIYLNRIGVGVDGSPIPNGDYGILANGMNTRIGPDNIIAYNAYAGIKLTEADKDFNTITRNSIYSNGALGIDLAPNGVVNPNDSNDSDTGPNEQLNYPEISTATTEYVSGTACGGCIIEVFIADDDRSGFGEGRQFVGETTAAPNGSFTVAISGVVGGQSLTSTATDPAGNTSEFSRRVVVTGDTVPTPSPTSTPTMPPGNTPTPLPTSTPVPTQTPVPTATSTPPAGPDIFARDSFSRSVTNGWGSPEVGGAYTYLGPASSFVVNGSEGRMSVPTGSTYGVAVGGVSVRDSDISFRVRTNAAVDSRRQELFIVAREVSSTTSYRLRVRLASNGQVYVLLYKVVSNQWTAIGRETVFPQVTHTANSYIRVRAQLSGASPTTVRVKVWNDGTTQPDDWLYTVTDSQSVLQGSGGIGLRSSVSTGSSGPSIIYSYDDLLVTEIP